MPYFLEYLTEASAGCCTVDGLDFNHALAKAKDALRGLECISAALLFSPDPKPPSVRAQSSRPSQRTEAGASTTSDRTSSEVVPLRAFLLPNAPIHRELRGPYSSMGRGKIHVAGLVDHR